MINKISSEIQGEYVLGIYCCIYRALYTNGY